MFRDRILRIDEEHANVTIVFQELVAQAVNERGCVTATALRRFRVDHADASRAWSETAEGRHRDGFSADVPNEKLSILEVFAYDLFRLARGFVQTAFVCERVRPSHEDRQVFRLCGSENPSRGLEGFESFEDHEVLLETLRMRDASITFERTDEGIGDCGRCEDASQARDAFRELGREITG